MKLSLTFAMVVIFVVSGCRTANVRVIDAATQTPVVDATVRPRYRSLIMGHPVTQLGPARRTDAEGRATFRTHWEQEFHSFHVDGTKAKRTPSPQGGETLLFVHRE